MTLGKALLVAALVLAVCSASTAQTRDGRLQVTVVDQTRGVLPSATVSILGIDDATKAAAPDPVTATKLGDTGGGHVPARLRLPLMHTRSGPIERN